MKRRILIPVDFSETSIEALRYAVSLAKPLGSRLTVLHVVEPSIHYSAAADVLLEEPEVLLEEQLRAARRRLSQLLDEFEIPRVCGIVRSGRPHEVIVEAATRLGADLIVMGTRGRTGASRFFIGSVAERVVRMATCPVLTVGPRRPVARVRPRPKRIETNPNGGAIRA